MHHLVIAALQEGRIERAERLDAIGGKAGGEGDSMLLGDADVEGAVGKAFGEEVEAGARRHGGGDGDDLVVALGLFDQLLGEHLGVGGRVGLGGLGLLAGDHVELGHGVVLVGGAFGRSVALALLRHDVDEDRAVVDLLDVPQHRHQVLEIVAVDRADVVEAQLLEQGAAGGHAAGVFLGLLGHVGEGTGQMAGDLLAELAHPLIGAAGHQLGEVGAHPADRRSNRHVVVVEDDDQPFGRMRGVVHRLIGHAGAHRAVADHRDDGVVVAAQIARHAKAERRRDRRRRVRRAKRVVFTFGALGEARQAAALAQGAHAVAPPGHDLVRIGLMADVPDHDIARGLEHVMQGDGQFDHAQTGAEVSAGGGDGADRLGPHVVGQTPQIGEVQVSRADGHFDAVEHRRGCNH